MCRFEPACGRRPGGTPREIVNRLNAAVVQALAQDQIRQKLIDIAQELVPAEQQSPEALAIFQKAEAERRWPIIKAAGLTGD